MTEAVTILILGAGSSSRMQGQDKLMQPVEGLPLIARQAKVALATGAGVRVTLPLDSPERASALAGLPVKLIPISDAAEGMGASLRGGIEALPAQTTALIVLLADMPEITTADLLSLIQAHRLAPDRIIRAATAQGTPGHPVLFPAWAIPSLKQAKGDRGAREMLARHSDLTTLIPLADLRAVTDLDTPEQWAAWRAARDAQKG